MYHNSTNCLIIASEATLVFIQDPKPCTVLIVSLCKCPTHMYIVFFDCTPRTHVGALSADTKDAYPVCIALNMHIMKYDRLVFVELHIHN